MVAAGILLSRIIGLVRNRVFAHYFGTSDAADAFNAAFRIPNFLQNLFGEGVLSASFIPVYAGLRAGGDEAARPAAWRRRWPSLLGLVDSRCWCWSGVLLTPWLIDADRAGLHGREARAHHPTGADSVSRARACWCCRPGASACSTAIAASSSPTCAPVLWNLAIIVALVAFGTAGLSLRAGRDRGLGIRASGSLLQFARAAAHRAAGLLDGLRPRLAARIRGGAAR